MIKNVGNTLQTIFKSQNILSYVYKTGMKYRAITNISSSNTSKFLLNFQKFQFSEKSQNDNNSGKEPEQPSSSQGCAKENCGCHSNVQEDPLERELKEKNYKILESINAGKYDEALDLIDEFINTIKSNFGEDHPFYCSALNNKAFILKTCGEFDEAKVIFEEVVEKYKRLYGDNNEKVVITMHNLATLLKDAKEFDKSLEIYERILKMIEKENIQVEGEQTGRLRLNIVANIYNSAGGLYRQLKNFAQADKLFDLAYNIIKTNFGETNLPIATVLNNIGLSLKDQGRYTEAMEVYTKALGIRKGLLPEDHPELMMTKHNIEQLKNEISSVNNKI